MATRTVVLDRGSGPDWRDLSAAIYVSRVVRGAAGDTLVYPTPQRVPITNPPTGIDLEIGQAYTFDTRVAGEEPITALITAGDGPLLLKDLVPVDPSTLEPEADPGPAWFEALQEFQGVVEAVAAEAATEATNSAIVLADIPGQVVEAVADAPTVKDAAAAAVAGAMASGAAQVAIIDGVAASNNTPIDVNLIESPYPTAVVARWGASGTPTGASFSTVANQATPEGIARPAYRMTQSSVASGGVSLGPRANGLRVATVPGDVRSASIVVESSKPLTVYPQMAFYNNNAVLTPTTGTQVVVPANTPTRLKLENVVAPANTTNATIEVRVGVASELGDDGWVQVTAATMNAGSTATAYRDGQFKNSAWEGTIENSRTRTALIDTPGIVAAALAGGAAKPSVVGALASGRRSVTNRVRVQSLAYGLTGWAYSAGAAGVATASRVAGAGHAGSYGYVIDWTIASTSTGEGPTLGAIGATTRSPCSPGEVVGGAIWAKPSVACTLHAVLDFYNGPTFIARAYGTAAFAAGEERRLVIPFAQAPANTTDVVIGVRPSNTSEMGTGDLTLSQPMIWSGGQYYPFRDGDSPDGFWSAAVGQSASSAALAAVIDAIAVYGDSHIQTAHGGGRTFPEHLRDAFLALGRDVTTINEGRGGETSTGVAVRQGGRVLRVTFPNNQIPASGTVAVTVTMTDTSWRDDATWAFYGWFLTTDGQWIYGTMFRAATTGAWTFSRGVAGSVVTVLPESNFRVATAKDYPRLSILSGGDNIPNATAAAVDYKGMTARVRDSGNTYLVLLGLDSAAAATTTALAAEYGHHAFDRRKYLIDYGLGLAGIAPTTADTAAIAANNIPPSLMADGVHLNDAGRKVVARGVAALVLARNLLTVA